MQDFICQLKNGYMLCDIGDGYSRRVYTGYPYPDCKYGSQTKAVAEFLGVSEDDALLFLPDFVSQCNIYFNTHAYGGDAWNNYLASYCKSNVACKVYDSQRYEVYSTDSKYIALKFKYVDGKFGKSEFQNAEGDFFIIREKGYPEDLPVDLGQTFNVCLNFFNKFISSTIADLIYEVLPAISAYKRTLGDPQWLVLTWKDILYIWKEYGCEGSKVDTSAPIKFIAQQLCMSEKYGYVDNDFVDYTFMLDKIVRSNAISPIKLIGDTDRDSAFDLARKMYLSTDIDKDEEIADLLHMNGWFDHDSDQIFYLDNQMGKNGMFVTISSMRRVENMLKYVHCIDSSLGERAKLIIEDLGDLNHVYRLNFSKLLGEEVGRLYDKALCSAGCGLQDVDMMRMVTAYNYGDWWFLNKNDAEVARRWMFEGVTDYTKSLFENMKTEAGIRQITSIRGYGLGFTGGRDDRLARNVGAAVLLCLANRELIEITFKKAGMMILISGSESLHRETFDKFPELVAAVVLAIGMNGDIPMFLDTHDRQGGVDFTLFHKLICDTKKSGRKSIRVRHERGSGLDCTYLDVPYRI